jgi:two-component system, cell cycle sensor histidine kinase and response regulator CckA
MNSERGRQTSAYKALLLEDNRSDAGLVMRKLATSGLKIEVDHVVRAQEFKERIRSGAYDLILCDFSLPGWNGLEAVKWVRRSGLEIPFIYVSGTLGEETAVECIKEGATDYVLKDNLSRLPHVVNRALAEWQLHQTHKRIEQEKLASEKQYKLLFEGNPQPMWVLDSNTMAFLAVNDAAVLNYGYSHEEFLRMTALDIVPSEHIKPVLRNVLQKQLRGAQVTEVRKHRKKDGTIIDVEEFRNEVKFNGIDGMLVMAHDVTELRRNEARLRQSEERFAKAFRSSPIAVTISTREEGRYVEVNDAFVRMIGRDRDEVIGHTSIELNIWEFSDQRDALIAELERSGRVDSFEASFNSKTFGSRAVRISAEPINLDGLPCIVAVSDDVTDAIALEERFRQAQKMEAVGRLAGGVAHDFNNMLSIIMGFCDLAYTREKLVLAQKDVLQIKKAATRAATLTSQLLAFSRRQVLRPSVINLNKVVNDFLPMLQRAIGENIELRFQPAEKLGNTKADLGQIEQVLTNLVVNARDAMPDGGVITIATAYIHIDEDYARQHPKVRQDDYIMLSISDTGSGMDAKTMAQVFDPFFTTKSPGMGTGLGLSMVYGAMQQSGGYVEVSSELGKGSTFRLYFPHVQEGVEASFAPLTEIASLRGSETILLVEDEDDLREVTIELLTNEGYAVLDAADAKSAMDRAESYSGRIDMLLTDVVLPGMSGPQLARSIVRRRPNLKVLYMSGYSGELASTQGLLEPGAALLSKPFHKRQLLLHVRSVLNRQG